MKGKTGIYKRGPVLWITYTTDGRKHRESTGTSDLKTAEKILAKRKIEIAENKFLDIKKESRVKFED